MKNWLFVISLFAFVGQTLVSCSEHISEMGDHGSGGGIESPEQGNSRKFVGVATFEKQILEIADVTVKAESGDSVLFIDTLSCADETCYEQDSLMDKSLLLLLESVGFLPEQHLVFYRPVAQPITAEVVWTVTSSLNQRKLESLQDSVCRVSTPWVGFVELGKPFEGVLSFNSKFIHRKDIERYFSDARHTVKTDTLRVAP